MTPSKIASVAALVGGLGWLAKVMLVWASGGTNTGSGAVGVMFLVGLAGLLVALAAGGYALVATAPIWLRAVVSVALPLLVLMVWQLFDGVVKALYTEDNWLRGELNVLLAAVVAVVLGLLGLQRARGANAPARPSRGGHRLAR
jgi:hypothetical protein